MRTRPRWRSAIAIAAALLLAGGCQSSGGPGAASGGLAERLIPGYEEAQLRKQVEADSFPTAAQALHRPMDGDR